MRDPCDVARQYRVQALGEGQFALHSTGSTMNLEVQKRGALLSFVAKPLSAHWHAKAGEAFHVVRLVVEEVTIGHSGNEGWSSPLVDNCFFVIDGEELRHVPLTEIRVVTDTQFDLEITNIARMRGMHANSEADRVGNRPLARFGIVHCEAIPKLNLAESLECTVGLSQEHFQSLLASCLARQISKIYLHGIGGALSSSFKHDEPRELILCAGDRLNVEIDTVSLEYFV